MKQRVLILGARGMLGQALVRVFHDAEVFAWDRAECDITDKKQVIEKIEEVRPSIMINAAAYNDVDGAETQSAIANRINGEAVGYLAETAASVGTVFVHYSTDYVFDGTKREGYREDDAPNPISAYGRSKLLGEKKATHFYLIRTSRLFGKQGNGKKSFVDLMLQLAATKEKLEVVDEELSSITYVEDLAQQTREIVGEKKPAGMYHVTNSGATTWYGFAKEIFTQAKQRGILNRVPELVAVPSSHFPRPAKRPAYSQLLNTKLPPLRPWQEALSVYLSSLGKKF